MIIKEITAIGKDILEAKENARMAIGAGELDDVQFEIIDAGTKGIFGFMKRPAKVRAFIEGPDVQEKPKRHEKPAREKSNNHSERAEGQNQPSQKKKKQKPERRPETVEQQDKPQAPKTEVIPEAELKMERREVVAGEDMSYDFVAGLISDIGLSAEAKLYALEDGTRRIIISGDDAAVLIGHHGDTLDALQYLANLASARKNSTGERDKSRVTIDIEGYRKKREETLRALARRMANKAKKNRRSVMLEPMSAYERRIIHSEIQGIEGVSTNSIGSDNNRKIVIFLTDKKPDIFPETPLTEEFARDEQEELASHILNSLDSYAVADDVDSDIVAVKPSRDEEDLSEQE